MKQPPDCPSPYSDFAVEWNGHTMKRTAHGPGILEVTITSKLFPTKEDGAAVITSSIATWPDVFKEILISIMIPYA